MSSIDAGKVLVTGANGFIAGWVIKTLLERGFSVRGTVRSADKIPRVQEVFPEYADHLELVVVPDIAAEGAFDAAIVGVDAVVHAAGPVGLIRGDPAAFLRAAEEGTASLLRSVSAPASTVKRVVHISSIVAITYDTVVPPPPPEEADAPPRVWTPADWNERAVSQVRAAVASPGPDGASASLATVYPACKVLAERAAWAAFEAETAKRGGEGEGWDLVVVCPPWVFGPVLGAREPEEMAFTAGYWMRHVVKREGIMPDNMRTVWIDVRDLAEAICRALSTPEAGGERFIVATEMFEWSEWVAIAEKQLGKRDTSSDAEGPKIQFQHGYDNKKAEDILGMRWRSKEEAAAFMIADYGSKGWI